jgi:ribosomal protein L9
MKKQEKVIFAHDNQWGKKYQIKELSRGLIRNYLLSKILFCNKKNLT